MRRKRIRMIGQGAYYHCISRVVAGEALFGEAEKAVFRKMLGQVAEFCGVEVLTYALMSNHFHLLVHVPAPQTLDDAELIRRYRALYGERIPAHAPNPEVIEMLLATGGPTADRWRRSLQGRMHDLSQFLKALKQRFAVWFNKTHGRFGTLWAERFKSLLVEGSIRALTTVAAYIDLNPVRAGLVNDPANYPWCGYAEAMAGRAFGVNGLCRSFQLAVDRWGEILANYQLVLLGKGSENRENAAPLRLADVGPPTSGSSAPLAEILRQRLRYFSDGRALGSRAFLSALKQSNDAEPGLPPAVKELTGADWGGLAIANRLRGPAVG